MHPVTLAFIALFTISPVLLFGIFIAGRGAGARKPPATRPNALPPPPPREGARQPKSGRPEYRLSIPPGRVVIHKPTDNGNGEVVYHFTILPYNEAIQDRGPE